MRYYILPTFFKCYVQSATGKVIAQAILKFMLLFRIEISNLEDRHLKQHKHVNY